VGWGLAQSSASDCVCFQQCLAVEHMLFLARLPANGTNACAMLYS